MKEFFFENSAQFLLARQHSIKIICTLMQNVFFVKSDKQVDLKFSYSENRMTLITDLMRHLFINS